MSIYGIYFYILSLYNSCSHLNDYILTLQLKIPKNTIAKNALCMLIITNYSLSFPAVCICVGTKVAIIHLPIPVQHEADRTSEWYKPDNDQHHRHRLSGNQNWITKWPNNSDATIYCYTCQTNHL